MNVVAAMPQAAKANPMSSAAGAARIAHGDWTRPRTAMTMTNAVAYRKLRVSAHTTSPSAMSPTPSGVDRIAS